MIAEYVKNKTLFKYITKKVSTAKKKLFIKSFNHIQTPHKMISRGGTEMS